MGFKSGCLLCAPLHKGQPLGEPEEEDLAASARRRSVLRRKERLR